MPIFPGQSLTAEPMNAPYENPPEMVTPEDAMEYHLDRLTEPDRMESVLDAMELGLDVVTLTEGILRGAVMDGQHSVDISLILAPVVHEFIKTTAHKAGIDYEEGLPDDSKERAGVKYQINSRKAAKILANFKDDGVVEDMSEEPVEQDEVMPMMDKAPKGLMSRMSKLEGEV